MGYFPGVAEDVAVVDGQKAMQLGDPVAHVHGDATHRLTFGEDQILLH